MIGIISLLIIMGVFFRLTMIGLNNLTYEEFLDRVLGYTLILFVLLSDIILCSVTIAETYLEYGTIFI